MSARIKDIFTSDKLRAWMVLRGDKKGDIVREFQKAFSTGGENLYSEGTTSGILAGTASPSKRIMKAIMDVTGLGLDVFEYRPIIGEDK